MGLKRAYKQTEIGAIPEDWHLMPLLSLVSIANGQVDPRREPYRSMILVAPDHIESGTGRLLSVQTATEQGAVSGKYQFTKGDILYCKIRPHLRKATLTRFDGLCSADMYPLSPAPGVSPGFVLATILGYRFSRFAESVSARTGMPKINRAELSTYLAAVPPTEDEQNAIAGALRLSDDLIESLERLIAKKRDVKQATMQELLSACRRLPGFVGPWRNAALGELGIWKGGMTPSMRDQRYWSGATIPWASSGDIKPGVLAETALAVTDYAVSQSKTTVVPAGSILIVTRSGILRRYLPVAMNLGPVAVNQDIKALIPDAGSDPQFLLHLLTGEGPGILGTCLKSGTTVESIEFTWLKRYGVRIPENRAEQRAIAAVLSSMDAEIAALEAKLAKARLIKQGMMQELLTGKIRLV